MEGLLPLLLATGLSGGFLYATAKRKKEGFQNAAAVLGPEHAQFTEKSQRKFNPIMNLANPANLPFSAADEKTVQQALGVARVTAADPSFQMSAGNTAAHRLGTGVGSEVFSAIKTCEKLKELNCDAFDDPNFAYTCGICHEGGRDSNSAPTLGGLYVSENDRLNAEEDAKRMGSRRVSYKPTVGTCAANRFTTTKQQCIQLKNQMECELKQNFDIPGCSQCYQDEKFRYIDPNTIKDAPTLVLAGSGKLKFTKSGKSEFRDLTDQPQRLEIPDFKEGDIVQLEISPENSSVAGFLTGQTASGTFTVDIIRLIQSDSVSGQKPRMAGFMSINGDSFTVIRPARGKSSMSLPIQNVFTFIDPSEPEASGCAAAPYITKASSAEFLNSGTCFKKGQQPGKYSLECLQDLFTNSGCAATGEGYPSDAARAKALMTGANGSLLNIAEIAGRVYTASQESYSGQRNGQKMTIPEWDTSSRFCTGKRILSPCDGDDKANGPLSTECLNYLWQNKGAEDTNPGSLGPTYTNTLKTSSLNGNAAQYCTSAGTMAPIGANGQPNAAAIAAANKGAGVNGVKQFYNQIHLRANDNSLPDDARKEALRQCYGVDLLPPPSNTIGPGASDDTTCVPELFVSSLSNPSPGAYTRRVQVKQNWIIKFTINPTTKFPPGNGMWGSILQITATDKDTFTFGDRVPGIWFWPNSTRLHVSLATSANQNWSVNTNGELPLNTESTVTVTAENSVIKISVTGGLKEEAVATVPGPTYVGEAIFNAPTKYGNASFIGTLKSLRYCSYNGKLTSVLDSNTGRTKSALQKLNYAPFDWSKASTPVAVMGPFGMNPWGKWWAPNFPDDGSARWIWSAASAANDEPSWGFRRFFYRYNNTSGAPISATVTAAIDNTGTLLINDNLIGNTSGNMSSWQVTLPTGESKIEISAANRGGPAGLIAICKQGSKTLFASNGEWTMMN
jgi:hypothetical protein